MRVCYNCFHELEENARICPQCGMGACISNASQYPHALPCGSVLAGKYLTGRVLGQGGFGITYVAQNYQTKELVAVKEYYPDSMAIRDASHSVTPYNMDRSSNFEYGKERFLEEAKTLSEFIGNPHIVRVISCFEENGTAYFVMEYVRGISLKKYLQGRGGRISWQEAMLLLTPVMDALSAVHEKGIIHRDVTPDNIVIPEDGSVKLLDFGAARYSIGERSQSLDVILKHGFAPYEQYIHRSRQGSFTDVYSLAATFYFAITGLTPPESVERIDNDSLQLPSSLGISIPAGVESALQKALAVRPNERIRTMGEFKRALQEGAGNSKGMIPAHGSDNAGSESYNPEKSAGDDIPQFGQKHQENVADVEDGKNNRTAANPSAECDTVAKDTVTQDTAAQDTAAQDTAAQDIIKQDTVDHKTKQNIVDQKTTDRKKEIDLTGYARNNEGKTGGNGGTAPQKKLPKWLIPAAAIAAVLAIFLIVKNPGSGKGTDLQSAADGKNTNTVLAADSEADHSDKTQTDTPEEDQLSPEMRDLLAKAEQGDMGAQYELGTMYYKGTGVEQNYDEALAWYTKAAELGSADAQYNLGEIYHSGSGTDKDDSKAVKYYRQAAEQDLPEAQNMLGNCMKAGLGTDQDFEGAFSWYEKSAQQGLPEAQFNLAETYAAGRGVDQSDEQAAEWYTSAAEQGLAKAQTNLGILYAQGKGVPQSEEEAFDLFEKAAEQGDPAGQLDLAYMYLTGTGTEQDYEKAVEFLVKAAENEEADPGIIGTAALTLAELYTDSRSVNPQKDKEQAARWSEIAEEQGDKESTSLMGIFDGNKLAGSEPQYHDTNYTYKRCPVCCRLFKTIASTVPFDDLPEAGPDEILVPDSEDWPYCSVECAFADGWEQADDEWTLDYEWVPDGDDEVEWDE